MRTTSFKLIEKLLQLKKSEEKIHNDFSLAEQLHSCWLTPVAQCFIVSQGGKLRYSS